MHFLIGPAQRCASVTMRPKFKGPFMPEFVTVPNTPYNMCPNLTNCTCPVTNGICSMTVSSTIPAMIPVNTNFTLQCEIACDSLPWPGSSLSQNYQSLGCFQQQVMVVNKGNPPSPFHVPALRIPQFPPPNGALQPLAPPWPPLPQAQPWPTIPPLKPWPPIPQALPWPKWPPLPTWAPLPWQVPGKPVLPQPAASKIK